MWFSFALLRHAEAVFSSMPRLFLRSGELLQCKQTVLLNTASEKRENIYAVFLQTVLLK